MPRVAWAVEGVRNNHIFGISGAILPIHSIQLLSGYDDEWKPFIGKHFIQALFVQNYLRPVLGPIFDVEGIFQWLNIKLQFSNPKRFDSFVKPRRSSHRAWKSADGSDLYKIDVSLKRYMEIKTKIRYIFILAEKPQWRICTKFGTGSRLADVIKCFIFFVDRWKGLGCRPTSGLILPLSVDFGLSPPIQCCAIARLW